MKKLEEMIISEGIVLPGNVLKVGNFLNQQVNPTLLKEMSEEFARLYKDSGANKIITVEASGIIVASTTAMIMGIPLVIAKKHYTNNLSGDFYETTCYSYTHNEDYNMVIGKEYLSPTDKVIILDDFLAVGNAMSALIRLVKESGASLVGCGVQIEKGFQGGGDKLRSEGVRIESLALIDSMSEDEIIFR